MAVGFPGQVHLYQIFKLMEERYNRSPTIITTNLDFPEWQNFLGNPGLVEALLSRLRHRCKTLWSPDLDLAGILRGPADSGRSGPGGCLAHRSRLFFLARSQNGITLNG